MAMSGEISPYQLQKSADAIYDKLWNKLVFSIVSVLVSDGITTEYLLYELPSEEVTKNNIHLAINRGLSFYGMSEAEIFELLMSDNLYKYLHIKNLYTLNPVVHSGEFSEILDKLIKFNNKFGDVVK